jgi:uncharacterized membrane protein
MTIETWLHFGHIAGAIAWVGGGLVLFVLGLRARASDDPAAAQEFGRVLRYVGPRVLVPGVAAVLVFGLAMVLTDEAWDFSQAWIMIALGLFALAFIIGLGYLSRIGIQLGRLGGGGASTADRRALVDRWLAGYGVVLVILAIAVWDMVFKPGS